MFVADPIRRKDSCICAEEPHTFLDLCVECQVNRLAGSRSRELAHIRDPWWSDCEVVVSTPRFPGESANHQAILDDIATAAKISRVIYHPWKCGIAVGRLRVTVERWAVASVELVHIELIVQRVDFLTNGSVALNDPIFVALDSFHCCWFPRHTFPGSTLDPSRQTDSEFESPVVVVANAEEHLKFLQVGNLVLEMPHQALPIFRPVVIERGQNSYLQITYKLTYTDL